MDSSTKSGEIKVETDIKLRATYVCVHPGSDAKVARTADVGYGLLLDLDADDKLLGIEILW